MKTLGVIFGGMSNEHDISLVSGTSVLKNLDKDKYLIKPIYIDESGVWYEFLDDLKTIEIYELGVKPQNIKEIVDVFAYLKDLDVVFPVLHGAYGEDGAISGLLKMLNIPCVGCGILSSSVCMNKFYTKRLLVSADVLVTPDICLYYHDGEYFLNDNFEDKSISFAEIKNLINKKLDYPVFVKPANSGSSVGITKVKSESELEEALALAVKTDSIILIEKEIMGREIECAILKGKPTGVGEVINNNEFYSFDAKYKNNDSKTQIPALLPEDILKKVRKLAGKAFRVVFGHGLARVDFLIENNTNKIYLNEINTMPGFTEISMYPKLVAEENITYQKLLDILIDNAV